jgi:ABC-type antimicrobial peptide transport system permease subunit
MDRVIEDARGRMTFALLLLAVGAGTTLLLGIVGLYGVIAYVVSLRSREISIRIALGLAPTGAARMILRQGETIVALGASVGIALFVVFSKLLESLAFEVKTLDVLTLAGAVVAVIVVATLATWVPARRAAAVNPAHALKAD